MLPERTAYFDRLRAELHLGGAENDVVRELATHVDDAVEQMVRQGIAAPRAAELAIARLGRPQTLAHLLRQAQFVTRWNDALFGALPLLLAALLIGARLWQSPIAAAAAAIIIVAVTLYGLWRGRPAWFYPWAGVALTLPLIAGYVAFVLVHQGAQAPPGAGFGSPSVGFAAGILYFPVGLIVVSGAVLVALRRDWLDASILLSPLPVALVWLTTVDRAGGLLHPDASITATSELLGVICVCMAAGVVAIMRARTRASKVAILVTTSVLIIALGDLAGTSSAPMVTIARAGLLVGFLLSPAFMARQLGSVR
jgi:hypothetical protein